jgi:hypothetical protein
MAEHWYHAVPIAPPGRGIETARRAALWALGHVAHHQAEEQLQCALELARMMPAGPERAGLELEILDQHSMVLIATTSYSGRGIAEAAARTRELCDEIGDPGRLVPALWRLATHHMMLGEIDTGLAVGNELIARGSAENGLPTATLAGHMGLGILHTQRGSIRDGRWNLDRAIEMCDAGLDEPLNGLVIEEPAVFSRVFSSINMWLSGDEVAAEAQAQRAYEIGMRQGPQNYSATLALWGASVVSLLRCDARETLRRSDEGSDQARTYGYPLALHVFGVTHGWATAMLGDPASGVEEIRVHADGFHNVGTPPVLYLRHHYLAIHADACLMAGDVETAHRSIDDGLRNVAETGEAWYEAELHRLRGEAFALADRRDPRAITSMRRAVQVAIAQGSENLRLRAESSLARLGAA